MWECGELSEEGRLYAGLQVTAWLTTKSKCSEVRVKVSTILFCTYCIKCHRFPCMRKALVTRTQLWCLLHSPGYCWGARQARGLLSVPWCACPGSGGGVTIWAMKGCGSVSLFCLAFSQGLAEEAVAGGIPEWCAGEKVPRRVMLRLWNK